MTPRPARGFAMSALVFVLSAFGSGCDVTKLTAESTAGLFERAAPAFNEYWDYDLAGEALPATIVQFEGILRIAPDNEILLDQTAQAYFGYAYGWVELDVEALEFDRKFAEAEEQRKRARMMYLRARDLAMYRVSLEQPEVFGMAQRPIEQVEVWLNESFTKKKDAPMLLWLAQAWGAYINTALDDMVAVADVPYAKAFAERSIELDPDYYYAAGYLFMGMVTASEMAADMDLAKSYFERALDATDRRSLLTQVGMARFYAVNTGDRELFDSLLEEVLEAGDVLPEARLANRMARVRAELYRANADQLF